jgi:uncharacterized protein YpuA (DUF1002 family)
MTSTRHDRLPTDGRSRPGLRLVFVLLLVTLVAGTFTRIGGAQDSETLISIGESNNDEQRAELLEYFGNPSDAEISVVSVADTVEAMREVVPDANVDTAYSSAALTCLPLGDGLEVQTININAITPAVYAMALVTAGVGDAQLTVASPASVPAGGLTALTGIFLAWDKVNCESSQSTKERQELALRQLGLTTEISTALGLPLTSNIGFFVIEVQRLIVINDLNSREDIEATIANQELTFAITLPEEQKAKLIDFMVDLVALDIDWSTFSAGWTIDFPSPTSIIMRGDGIAILNAQASATARAAEEMTATAQAEKDARATERAEKRATQTAIAQQTIDAEAALTQTALAQPTATATATPMPFEYQGTLAAPVEDNQLILKTADDQEVAYTVAQTVSVMRDDAAASVSDLKKGDGLSIKVDAMTNEVVAIVATAAPENGTPFAKLIDQLPVLLLIPLGMVVRGRSFGDPFVVKRVARD